MLARDRGGPRRSAFQMPIYPMIDDRNRDPRRATRSPTSGCVEPRGQHRGLEVVPRRRGRPNQLRPPRPRAGESAGPCRRTFIDVGTVDLFRDEDIAFSPQRPHASRCGRPSCTSIPVPIHAAEVFRGPDWRAYRRRIWTRRLRGPAPRPRLIPGRPGPLGVDPPGSGPIAAWASPCSSSTRTSVYPSIHGRPVIALCGVSPKQPPQSRVTTRSHVGLQTPGSQLGPRSMNGA